MTLNKQLLCVGLILLSLPWAGCQYLRELDAGLKQSQQQSLEAATAIIARSLSVAPEKLDPHGAISTALDEPFIVEDATARAIYCHPLTIPVRADGYFEEWDNESQNIPWSAFPELSKIRYRCGVFDNRLSLAFAIEDDDVIYNNPTQSLVGNGDRIKLATGKHDYIFTAVAPGEIVARYFLNPHTTYRESRIDAAWIDNDSGYQLEIVMPLALTHNRLGFSLLDENRQGNLTINASYFNSPPPRFVYQAPVIEKTLKTFQQQGIRLQLLNPMGWVIAKVGDPDVKQTGKAHWLLRKLYRTILETSNGTQQRYLQSNNNSSTVDLSQREEISKALNGTTGSHWYRDPQRSDYQLLSAAIPISDGTNVVAVLVAEQSSEQTSALTDSAFNRLFSLSFAVFVGAVAVLLIYASWLSWRIRRLSNATQAALEDRNYQTSTMPNSQARDEIGTLTRNYSELMKRIAEYTDYLQTLSRKLSHELRTPLAIIHSSLDNLAAQELNANSQTYQQRAKDGALRLGNILTAMSEARRVEESIEHAESERIEAYDFVEELAQAYRDVYPDHRIQTDFNIDKELHISAVPDLLVQMLDKLMDNASDFCPTGGVIKMAVAVHKNRIQLIVSNDGPLLPETMQSQLFDNMVSLRETREDSMHLGLGLHIVQLIVDYHDGQVQARNRADNAGVEFIVSLPL